MKILKASNHWQEGEHRVFGCGDEVIDKRRLKIAGFANFVIAFHSIHANLKVDVTKSSGTKLQILKTMRKNDESFYLDKRKKESSKPHVHQLLEQTTFFY
jgi:hypothetical protein